MSKYIKDADPKELIDVLGIPAWKLDDKVMSEIATAWEKKDVFELLEKIPRKYAKGVNHASAIAGMQDTFESGTGGNVRIGFGHGKSYYTKGGKYLRHLKLVTQVGARKYNGYNTAQAFANWTEALGAENPAQYAMFKRLWPETSKKFEGLIEDYERGFK